ncbi:MAG TPA: hypothetical protein VKV15_27700 [Bryobacteraceae bacterium]|nr:hypothetical protein [Bryobacteraceae bacterium]
MKARLLILTSVLAAAVFAASPEKPRVGRAQIDAMEKNFDQRLSRLWNEPFLLLGTTRGFYLDGFGAVFSAEINLVNGPNITPFQPVISKAQVEQHKKKKLERVPALKEAMRQMLTASAASLDGVPADEQIVVEVTISKYSWEDIAGVPTQILMQAQKKKLLEAQRSGVDAAIREQEFSAP